MKEPVLQCCSRKVQAVEAQAVVVIEICQKTIASSVERRATMGRIAGVSL